jgi:two-component system sensor histidine kinase YesM
MREKRTNSIRRTLHVTNTVIVLATLVPLLTSSLYYNLTMIQYKRIIQNVYTANSLASGLQGEIYTAMWNVVSGKTRFEENVQYHLLGQIERSLDELRRNAYNEDNSYLIQVAGNTMETLTGYVDAIGENIARGGPVRQNEVILGEISSVSELLYDVIQRFVAAEMEIAHLQSIRIQRSMDVMTAFLTVLLGSILVFLYRNSRQLNRSIKDPIYRLKTMASRIAQGDLSIRVKKPEIRELDELTDSLNTMAEKLGALIAQNLTKQQHLQKAEMKALQAQIAPHFMYNTLDTILSLAEDGQNEDVVTTTLALSNFFRLSLSNGRDWVPVAEETSHVESYLAIQKIRYGAILEYEIDVDETILREPMLKIVLQPLVENAIYHGIKETRRAGLIRLTGCSRNGFLEFVVEDNGLGMRSDKLRQLRENLCHYDVTHPGIGFGLYNVMKRIQLYYEIDDGLTIESEYNRGTTVTLRLPVARAATRSAMLAVSSKG